MQQLELMDSVLKALNQKPRFRDSVLLVLLVRIKDTDGTAFPQQGLPALTVGDFLQLCARHAAQIMMLKY